MPGIAKSVGDGGENAKADVALVQTLLNDVAGLLGVAPLDADGLCGKGTIAAIKAFQFRFTGITVPDGRIDPGGRTFLKLQSAATAASQQPAPKPATKLSGADWWKANQAKYANSAALSDLAPVFRDKARTFVAALRNAGATVTIGATRRNKTRAWLMHHCFMIAKGQMEPADVPPDPACDIVWDHGDPAKSRKAAQEMVDMFAIVYLPSLTSRHIEGNAIDMTIGWAGTLDIEDADGATYGLTAPRTGDNRQLHRVGRSYGVVKLLSDPPHWSSDGH
ncbi:MAG TPA: peptidoglycan-binding domain-containing protein [Sphingobium sp.]